MFWFSNTRPRDRLTYLVRFWFKTYLSLPSHYKIGRQSHKILESKCRSYHSANYGKISAIANLFRWVDYLIAYLVKKMRYYIDNTVELCTNTSRFIYWSHYVSYVTFTERHCVESYVRYTCLKTMSKCRDIHWRHSVGRPTPSCKLP